MVSTNGTRVNGEPVTAPRELRHGDLLWIGPAIIEVALEQEPEDVLFDEGSGNFSATNPYLDVRDL
jgi:pSer/pThr/pTyr-binding forkhead associated (FHA) protein